MRRVFSLLLAVLLLLTLAGCGKDGAQSGGGSAGGRRPGNAEPDTDTVGICLPNDTDRRWLDDAAALTQQLEASGCAVVTEYAQDDPFLQASQIQAMISRPVVCLVVAAVDSLALTDVLQQAKEASIPVIAYDRLLMQTDAVSYYVGFDYQAMGVAMANHIVQAKQLETAQAESRSHTIEFFMGSPEDNNAFALYTGILQVLQPYLDSGVLVCVTGRTAFEDVCMQDWSGDLAVARCQSYLTEHYPETLPQILCAASDALAAGCVAALETAGHAPGETWPVIIGQGGDLAAAKRIVSGHQSMTVHTNPSTLIPDCVAAVKDVLDLATADTVDAGCHNGMQQVPAFFSGFTPVDSQNYREALVSSGIYTEEQLTVE